MSEILVVLIVAAVALAIFLLKRTANGPKQCSSCGMRTVVEFCRKPMGGMIASGAMNGDATGIIGSGRPSVVYMVTYKCKECDEEYTMQSSRR